MLDWKYLINLQNVAENTALVHSFDAYALCPILHFDK